MHHSAPESLKNSAHKFEEYFSAACRSLIILCPTLCFVSGVQFRVRVPLVHSHIRTWDSTRTPTFPVASSIWRRAIQSRSVWVNEITHSETLSNLQDRSDVIGSAVFLSSDMCLSFIAIIMYMKFIAVQEQSGAWQTITKWFGQVHVESVQKRFDVVWNGTVGPELTIRSSTVTLSL